MLMDPSQMIIKMSGCIQCTFHNQLSEIKGNNHHERDVIFLNDRCRNNGRLILILSQAHIL